MTTVWNSADKSANITLYRNGLMATSSANGSNWKCVRATTSLSTGKKVWEIYVSGYFNDNGYMVGLANASLSTASFPGSDGNSLGYQPSNGAVYKNGSSFSTIQSSGALWGLTIQIAVDLGAKLVWFRTDRSPSWNNNVVNDPATGVGGLSYAATGAIFPAWGGYDGSSGNMCSINTGSFTFSFPTLPTGFTAWDTGTVTALGLTGAQPSAFDPGNKDTHITLSNSNFTALNTSTNNQSYAVKSNTAYGSGRLYIEMKAEDWALGSGINGMFAGWGATGRTNASNPGQDFISSGLQVGDASGFTGAYINGQRNMASSTFNTARNDIIGIAIDVDRGLWWAKNITAGSNWNGDSAADPGTSAKGWAVQVAADYPYFTWSANGVSHQVQATVNFGASAFVGSVPSGFSRWDPLVGVVTDAMRQTAVSVN
jgi:hypothetical protein